MVSAPNISHTKKQHCPDCSVEIIAAVDSINTIAIICFHLLAKSEISAVVTANWKNHGAEEYVFVVSVEGQQQQHRGKLEG